MTYITPIPYLSECSLGIRSIVKSIKDFLESHDLFSLLVDGLPDDAVGSLAKLLQNVKFAQDVWLNFLCHRLFFC